MHTWRVPSAAALNAVGVSRRYIWAKRRPHPTPGLPTRQNVLPFALINPAPTGAPTGTHQPGANRGACGAGGPVGGSAVHADLHSFVHAHDMPPADLASMGLAYSLVCVVNARRRAPMKT
eukprot:364373-Chlamydomonas_euryale.AAC.7